MKFQVFCIILIMSVINNTLVCSPAMTASHATIELTPLGQTHYQAWVDQDCYNIDYAMYYELGISNPESITYQAWVDKGCYNIGFAMYYEQENPEIVIT